MSTLRSVGSGYALKRLDQVEYGFDGVSYPLPDGRQVRFRGAVDRIDEAEDGTLTVIDYKTGKTDDYRDLSSRDPHQRGTHLQLAVYGSAVGQLLGRAGVDARYWFVTARGDFQRIGYPVTPPVLAEVGHAIGAIVDDVWKETVTPKTGFVSYTEFEAALRGG